jgi:hypothetical protein
MKKHITLLSGLLIATGTFAQVAGSNIPMRKKQGLNFAQFDGLESKVNQGTLKVDGALVWEDNFSGTNPWTMGSEPNGVQGAFEIGTNSAAGMLDVSDYMGQMASTTAANGFAFFNGVQYLLAVNVNVQNAWIKSEVIDFTGVESVQLTFQQRYRAFNSDVCYVEFSEDGGTTWSVSQIVNSTVATNASAVQNTVTLDFPVNGTATGMIRFRWEEVSDDDDFGSGYGWCIDDVKIYSGYGNNMQMLFAHNQVGTQGLQYTKFPSNQVVAGLKTSFGAEVKNTGYNDQDAYLNVIAGAYDFTGTTPVAVASFTNDSVAILEADGFEIPSTVGVYNYNYTVVTDSVLVQTTDDVKTKKFEVTNSLMATDNFDNTSASIDGVFTAFQSQSTNDLTGIGTYFEVFADGVIGAFQVGIGTVATAQQAQYTGREFYVTVLKFDGTDFVYETQTDPMVFASTMFGKTVTFFLPQTIDVVAGDVLIVMANAYVGSTGGGIPFAFSGVNPAGTTVGTTGETFPDDLTGLASDDATPYIVEAPVVRVDFQSYVGINENVATDLSVAPNPFNNETAISFNLKASSEVSVIVTDLAGRTVLTVPASILMAGNQTVAIDGSSLNAGVYNATLKIGNDVVTKRIVKK